MPNGIVRWIEVAHIKTLAWSRHWINLWLHPTVISLYNDGLSKLQEHGHMVQLLFFLHLQPSNEAGDEHCSAMMSQAQ